MRQRERAGALCDAMIPNLGRRPERARRKEAKVRGRAVRAAEGEEQQLHKLGEEPQRHKDLGTAGPATGAAVRDFGE